MSKICITNTVLDLHILISVTFLWRSNQLKRFHADLSWARLQFIWDALQLSRISTGGNFIKNFSPSSSSPCASNHHAFAKHLEGGQLSKRDLNYVRKFTRGFSSVQLDGVPVSVSERLFGFFVLILFGVDEYFSCINYHISKDMYWARTGHLKAWVIFL